MRLRNGRALRSLKIYIYSVPCLDPKFAENVNFFLFVGLLLTITIEKWYGNGILFPKLFWSSVRKICSCDREKLLKFEADGQEFAKILRSLQQFIQTQKFQNNFW